VIVININERTDVQGNVRGNRIAGNLDKNGTRVNLSGSFQLTLTSVWFHPSLAWDELPWDGPSEFFCVTSQQIEILDPTYGSMLSSREAGWGYMGNLATGVTHTRSDAIGSGVLGLAGSYYGYPVAAVKWWEDDFVYGPDPFDDDLGWHTPLNLPTTFGGVQTYSFNNGLVAATYRANYY
jgi:hypothetical protein